ncbi:MAG: hypothetical protein Q8N90_02395 [bacterium]|nr:hypothetical protein [bacterium]
MSKKNTSVLVSAMGVLTGFSTAFAAAFKKRGGTDEQLYELLVGKKSEDFIAKIVDRATEMVAEAKPAFPIFKTITLGVCKSIKDYREALIKANFRIGDWASDILNKIRVSQFQVQLDLVVRTVADLGFKEAARLDRIYAKAKELGLELCPPEVGPALRLAYPDQPHDEWLRIAMDPISDSGGPLRIFGVVHGDDGQWLDSGSGNPGGLWDSDDQFLFVLPRK